MKIYMYVCKFIWNLYLTCVIGRVYFINPKGLGPNKLDNLIKIAILKTSLPDVVHTEKNGSPIFTAQMRSFLITVLLGKEKNLFLFSIQHLLAT